MLSQEMQPEPNGAVIMKKYILFCVLFMSNSLPLFMTKSLAQEKGNGIVYSASLPAGGENVMFTYPEVCQTLRNSLDRLYACPPDKLTAAIKGVIGKTKDSNFEVNEYQTTIYWCTKALFSLEQYSKKLSADDLNQKNVDFQIGWVNEKAVKDIIVEAKKWTQTNGVPAFKEK